MRWVAKILKWLGYGLLGLLALGAIYQQVGNALDSGLAPPASEMISVNGHGVHVACKGQGRRTYVLDSGAGVGSFEWMRLEPLLAGSGRVCAFDRPGLGWSEDSGEPHDVSALATQIAAIVRAAKIPRPFVYVGHSLGANIAMVYRDKYPGDVSALVLIEPGVPKDLLEDFHGTRAEAMNVTDCGWTCHAAAAAAWLGVTRIGARLAGAGGHSLSAAMQRQYLAELARPSQVTAIVATLDTLPKSAYEDMDVRSFGDTPVLVLTASQPRTRDSDESEAAFKQWRVDQLAYFASLAAKSTHGKGPVVIPNSSHVTIVMGETQAPQTAKAIVDFAQDAEVGPPPRNF